MQKIKGGLSATSVDIAYRPDLDGLRALAVWLVVVFHVGFDVFPGGFVGVDVFFVLSGFFITSLILKNLDNGRFTYRDFYLRRFRRLLPAYLTVALASLVVAYWVLLPEDFMFHLRMLGLALLSVGNFYIANVTDGYFAPDVESIPLLHTWSLAVEEQFYLLWPLCLVLICRFYRGNRLFLPFMAMTLLLLALSEWYTRFDPVRGYYLLPARSFELMLGAAMATGLPRLPPLGKAGATLLAWVGLAGIILSALLLSATSLFPGVNALWPCLGTALLIYTGRYPNIVQRLLSGRTMVFLGKLSYSLYLWHWVVIAYMNYLVAELTLPLRLAAIVISTLASYLTWKFVENPFRFNLIMPFGRTVIAFIVLPLALFAGLTLYAGYHDGLPQRFGDRTDAAIAVETHPTSYRDACASELGTEQGCADILLIGDSHARHFQDFIGVLAEDADLTLASMVWPGCQPLLGVTTALRTKVGVELKTECEFRNERAFAAISGHRYVVLGGYWSQSQVSPDTIYFLLDAADDYTAERSMEAWRQGVSNAVQAIVVRGAIPVIIRGAPSQASFHCLVRRIIWDGASACDLSFAATQSQQRIADEWFDALQRRYPQLVLIDPKRALCDAQICVTELREIPLYKDEQHLNGPGSRILGELFLEREGNPFARK